MKRFEILQSMTLDEFAEWLFTLQVEPWKAIQRTKFTFKSIQDAKKWLESEVTDNDG